MKLYHHTFHAKEILTGGFKDSAGNYLTDYLYTGVWFSNVPLDENEGAKGDAYLIVELPVRIIKPFEWIEEGKPYREFLIPAEIVNQYQIKMVEEKSLPNCDTNKDPVHAKRCDHPPVAAAGGSC